MQVTDNARIIKAALRQFSHRETEALLNRIKNEPEPSAEFYEKLDKRVAEIKTQRQKSLSRKKTIAILIAATLILASILVACVENNIINIGGFSLEFSDGNIVLHKHGKYRDIKIDEVTAINYIPEGFELTETQTPHNAITYIYTQGDKRILLHFRQSVNGHIGVNTENCEYSVITLGDRTLHKSVIAHSTTVVWTDETLVYTVDTEYLSWEEMVKIIEGISYVGE